MKAITFIASSLITVTGFSQMNSFDADPEELVYDILQGQSISISNVQFQGHPRQIGYFDGNTVNIPFQSGVILSSGLVNGYGPWGPNDGTYANTQLGQPGDLDLKNIVGLGTKEFYDAGVLEFDFIPSGDSLKLRLLFASDEYSVTTNSTGYIDGAVIILTTPDNVQTNIAKILGSPISIVSVRYSNPSYYINNGNGQETPYNSSDAYCRYNMLSKPITAKAQVTPNQTHHLKIAIGDMTDEQYDSALFIEAHSMTADLKDDIESNLQLSPNPVNDFLTIESSTENLTIHILDLNGKNLLTKDLSGLSGSLDLSSLQSGTYLVKICSSTNTLTKKIIKL